MPPFSVPKLPTVHSETMVGPSPSTAESTSLGGSAECHVSGYDLESEFERASNASSEPPPDFGDEVAVDLQNPANNYRKGHRLNDFKNKDGIVCYKNTRQTQLVRCARKFVTLENMNSIFLNPTGGVIHYNKSIRDFFEFVVHTSGQGDRKWGTSLNLKDPAHLRLIKKNWSVLNKVKLLQMELRDLGGEETIQSSFLGLVSTVFTIALWRRGRLTHQIKTIGGGHVAYAPCENDINQTYQAAIGTFIDTIWRSLCGKRRVVLESKKPGEIDSATSESALIQALTGALGERADIAIISTGIEFGIYWFERTGRVTRLYKVLDVHDLVDASDDDEKLVEIAAHIAFFLAEPLVAESEEGEKDQPNTNNDAAGEPASKKPRMTREDNDNGGECRGEGRDNNDTLTRTTLEENHDVGEDGGHPRDLNEVPKVIVKASSDIWEEVHIEGPEGKLAVCTVLRADLNEETRLAIMGEFEQESDDEY